MNSEKLLAEAKEVVRDLSVRELIEASIRNGEGTFSDRGALRVTTGTHTGRSPKDKFIVDTPLTHDIVNWDNNQACTEETFNRLYAKCEKFIKTHRVYVKNVKAGADPSYQIRVKFINEMAWQTVFISQLFIKTDEPSTVPEDFTVISLPDVMADPAVDGTNSETFIILNFDKKVVLIGGGLYAGELKKSIFSVMNFLLPQQDVLSMHCSCNEGSKGDVALFFGLSGTGKTTLSADPHRALIGDDEHGWGDNGVFKPEVPEPRKVVRRVYPQVRGKHPHAECPCEVYRAQPHAAPQVEHAHMGRKGDVCGQFFGEPDAIGAHHGGAKEVAVEQRVGCC